MPAAVGEIDILHLTTVHRWDDVRIFVKEARTAAAAGYRTMLAAPDAPDGVRDGVGWVRLRRHEGRAARVFRGLAGAARQVLALRPRLVHIHDPELFLLTPLFRGYGIQVVLDLHEYLPTQVRVKAWIPAALRGAVALATRVYLGICVRMASQVVAATETIAGHFPGRPVTLVRNYPLLSEFLAVDRDTEAPAKPAVAYAGGISKSRGAEIMVNAMAKVRTPDMRLTLAGRWLSPAEREAVASLPGWSRVEDLGWLDREGIRRLYGGAIAGLFVSEPNAHTRDSLPIKLFEYMAAGLPVVVSDFPIWRSIVDESRCGIVLAETTAEALAEVLDQLAADPAACRAMGDAGRAAVLQRYNWEAEKSSLLAAYGSLIGNGHA